MSSLSLLRFPALAYHQGENRTLYAFVAPGSSLSRFLTVSRAHRDLNDAVQGYQRAELSQHIGEIRDYLLSEHPMLPNALVVAFDERVRFVSHGGGQGEAITGVLEIPDTVGLDPWAKPGWVVDGQQRMAALRDADLEGFWVCIVAFVAADEDEQREQFILVNTTRALPNSLVYELLPDTTCRLPRRLASRKFPASVLTRLARDADSPVYGRIRTTTFRKGLITDNAMLTAIEHSLEDGALYRYRDPWFGEHDLEAMLRVLKAFWRAVATVFPAAWDLPPRKSRLTHGAGIIAMGYVMDAISYRRRDLAEPTEEAYQADLERLAPACRWTEGVWVFGPDARRAWHEIQNTPRDVRLLAEHLLEEYHRRVIAPEQMEAKA